MSQCSNLFAIVLMPGHGWQDGIPLEDQNIGAHRDYLRALAARHVVAAAGPFRSVDGGLILMRAADMSHARELMQADPGVRDGLFSATLYAWSALIDPEGRLADRSAAPTPPKI